MGTVEEISGGLAVRRPGADEDETPYLWTKIPIPRRYLLDGFRDYVLNDVEPPFSGPRNLATVGLINALGASSEQGVVIDFDEYMAAE